MCSDRDKSVVVVNESLVEDLVSEAPFLVMQ